MGSGRTAICSPSSLTLARLTGTCQLAKRSEGLPKYLAPRQQRRTRRAQRGAAEAAAAEFYARDVIDAPERPELRSRRRGDEQLIQVQCRLFSTFRNSGRS